MALTIGCGIISPWDTALSPFHIMTLVYMNTEIITLEYILVIVIMVNGL